MNNDETFLENSPETRSINYVLLGLAGLLSLVGSFGCYLWKRVVFDGEPWSIFLRVIFDGIGGLPLGALLIGIILAILLFAGPLIILVLGVKTVLLLKEQWTSKVRTK